MKKMIKFILCLSVFVFIIKMNDALATANSSEMGVKVLLVVDESGSMELQKEYVKQALQMLYKCVENEFFYWQTELILFGNEARPGKLEDLGHYECKDKYTDVLAGMYAADSWVQERLNGGEEKLCVIVISDLIEDGCRNFDVSAIEEKQKKLRALLLNWDEYEDRLVYHFITWDGEYNVDLSKKDWKEKVNAEVNTFKYCISSDKESLLNDVEDKKKKICILSEMIRAVITNIVGTEKGDILVNDIQSGEEKSVEISKAHALYVIADGEIDIDDSRGKDAICNLYDIIDIKVYRINMNLSENEIESTICANEDCVYAYFEVYAGTNYKPYIELKQKYYTGEKIAFKYVIQNQYVLNQIDEPLFTVFYLMDEMNEIKKVNLISGAEGEYSGEISLEEAGVYYCKLQTEHGQEMCEDLVKIVESPTPTATPTPTSTPIPTPTPVCDETVSGIRLLVVVIIILAFALLVIIIHKRSKQQDEQK